MWQSLLAALGLLLVIEGIMPFLRPATFREALLQVAQFPDRALRTIGLCMLILGALVIYWVR